MEQYCLEAPIETAQPRELLAAYVGQLLAEVKASQIARFRQLRPKLQCDVFACDNASLTHSVQGLLAASRNLDFQSLRNCGFVARLTGAAERAARVFDKRYREVLSEAAKVKRELEMLSGDSRAHTSGVRKVIVELDIEHRALNREIDQAAEWLVELSYAMPKAQATRAASTDAIALSRELKRFRAASTLAREIAILGQNVLERRTALFERLEIDLDGFDKVWVRWVSRIGAENGNHRVPLPVHEKAREVHAELLARLELTNAACSALQMEEHALQRRLALFRDCLEEQSVT